MVAKKKKTGKSDRPSNRRRHVRFKPDPGAVAYIDLNNDGIFRPEIVGLICQESQSGAGLIVISKDGFEPGTQFWAQIGKLSPLPAIVRWQRKLDDSVFQVGIEYLS